MTAGGAEKLGGTFRRSQTPYFFRGEVFVVDSCAGSRWLLFVAAQITAGMRRVVVVVVEVAGAVVVVVEVAGVIVVVVEVAGAVVVAGKIVPRSLAAVIAPVVIPRQARVAR